MFHELSGRNQQILTRPLHFDRCKACHPLRLDTMPMATVVLVHCRTNRNCEQHSHNVGTMPVCFGTCCSSSLRLKFLWLPSLSRNFFSSSFVSTLSRSPHLRIGSPCSLILSSLSIRMIMPFHGDDPLLNRAYVAATLHRPLGTHIYKGGSNIPAKQRRLLSMYLGRLFT